MNRKTTSVLVDCTNTYSGGAKTHLREVFSRIPTDDLQTVYTFVAANDILELLPGETCNVTRISSSLLNCGALGRHAWRLFCLPWLVRKYDLAFFPGGTVTGRPRKSVTMSRNMLPFMREEYLRYGFSKSYFKMELLRILQRRSFRRADGIIFLSEFAREMVAAEIGRQPDSATGFGTMIPHGVTEEFRSVRDSSEIRTLSNDDEISLLYVSSFDVYKNQETVLSAVNKVRDDGWNIKVRFVGPKNDYAFGEFSKQRSKLDPKGDWSSVVFEVSQRALREYYRESDFFVYASTCENLPNILLEAMAARIPILCSDARPMSDILGRGGRYFVPRDASSLSEAIVGAIASPQETKNAVQIAYERVSEYDWDICAQTTLSYLSECAR